MTQIFTAYIEFDPDTKQYVGTVPGLVGAHAQAPTLDELHGNLKEVVALILEEQQKQGEQPVIAPFVGIQQIEVNV